MADESNYIPELFTEESLDAWNDICSNAMSRIYHENNLDIRDKTVAWTIWYKVTEEIARRLGQHPNESIVAGSLMTFSCSMKKYADNVGEKSGNIVPKVDFGESFKLAVKNDNLTEEDE